MRALIQRVTEASVSVDGTVISQCGAGALILVCAMPDDTDATADALAYGWKHWERVRSLDHPAAYLWQVGRNRARRIRARKRLLFESVQLDHATWVEPGLPRAVARLSERQRVAVMLIYGFEWTFAEVAELLGVSRSTVQKHTERAMDRLRRELGTES